MAQRLAGRKPDEAGAWSDPSPHTSSFVNVNGTRLHCLDWGGSGPNLILIHGALENPHLFDDLAPAFTDRFRVIAYARRGHGRSDSKGPFDNATLTEDLRQLMDAHSIGKAHLAGHSMGGNEVTAMAGLHPERVDRIVYLDAAYDWADPVFAEAARSLPPHIMQDSPSAMVSIDAYREEYRGTYPAVSNPSVFEGLMRDTVDIQPDGTVRQKMSEGTLNEVLNSLITERRDYTRVRAPALAIYAESFWDVQKGNPTYVAENLAWEQKYIIPLRATSIERVRRELPSVEILRVRGTHNDLFFTCRKEIIDSMRQFLGV
ncbi:MAG: alpha/beta hydrolase [Thermoplasmata archaeon]